MDPVTAEHLVDLAVDMCPLDWRLSQFPNLRHLSLSCFDEPTQVIDIICTMPKLQSLMLDLQLGSEEFVKPTSVASPPELEKIYLSARNFALGTSVLDAIMIPPAAKVTVSIHQPHNIPEIVDRVIQHARRQEASSNPRIYLHMAHRSCNIDVGFYDICIRSYSWGDMEDKDDIVYQACEDIFSNTPQHIRNLPTQLHLDCLSAEQVDLFLPLIDRYYNVSDLIAQAVPCTTLVELLVKPQPTSSDRNQWICPRMRSIRINTRESQPPMFLDFDSLQTLAESRQHAEEKGVMPLEKVTVRGRQNIHRSTVEVLKSLVSNVDIPNGCILEVSGSSHLDGHRLTSHDPAPKEDDLVDLNWWEDED
ncbi:hypothetical protein FRB99_006683 [Tulasnella sp. 403]|nr:hypothetical protein FRB99_006683 [Tulasnella sp. 403]